MDPELPSQWSALMRGLAFISDLGPGLPFPRYAAWAPTDEGHRIVEVGEDLQRLQAAHGVADERVLRVEREG